MSNEPASPEQIAVERARSRENMIQPGERVAAELARIADTLESMRRDVRALLNMPLRANGKRRATPSQHR